MIFVVELPAGDAEPQAWFAFHRDDLLRKIAARGTHLPLAAAAGGGAAADEGCCLIYWDEAEATAAFERAADPAWQGGRGWRARVALREQLIALEVLADDL